MKYVFVFWVGVFLHHNVPQVSAWWRPTPGTKWQWQLGDSHRINTEYAVEMYDLDLYETSVATIANLKSRGIKVVCYFSAGTYEPGRIDSGDFPSSAIGKRLEGGHTENYIDFRRSEILRIMRKRLDLAKRKGCDCVEPDNVDGAFNDNGLGLSKSDQLTYNKWLANETHSRGLSVGLKNDVEQIKELEPHFDWALNVECLNYEECEQYVNTFLSNNKAVFHVEYVDNHNDDYSAKCSHSGRPRGFSTIIKDWDLTAWRRTCQAVPSTLPPTEPPTLPPTSTPSSEFDGQNLTEVPLVIGLTTGLPLLIIGGLVGTCIYIRKRNPLKLKRVAFDDIDSAKKYDVFLCYKCGGDDETFCVKQLLPKLEEWGFRVVLHARDFIPGKEIAENILEAVENTRRVILIISKDFLQSEWCRFEYQAAQHAMVCLQTRIVPILFWKISKIWRFKTAI